MKSLITLLLLFSVSYLPAQCVGNLLTNGSFTSLEGEAVTAPGWTGQSTPDVNIEIGPLNCTPGYNWFGGTPIASSDGGTWQNLFSDAEFIEQSITVTPGQSYTLKFEYTSHGIQSPPSLTYTDPVGINIYLNNVLTEVAPADITPFTWENYCYVLTAETSTLTLKLSASEYAYAGLDGVCLLPLSNSNSNTINLGNDTTLCVGQTLLLDATSPNAGSYLWQDNSSNSTYTVTQQGTYFVKVTNDDNCSLATDTISVTMINCTGEEPTGPAVLTMPNIFTPDNDGINDFFEAKEIQNITEASLRIVNRWGDLMFETTDLTMGWNGKTNGEDSPEGVYFWIVDYTKGNQQVRDQGFLHLFRD
jgi:gliding motility-associated-like protein